MQLLKKSITVLWTLCVCVGCMLGGCKDKQEDLTVYMPDGAPALAMAKLMHEDTETDGVVYQVVKSDLIAAQITNKDESKNADLCVLPVTAASKLVGNGERYTMLGTVTHGNLYLIAKEVEETAIEGVAPPTTMTEYTSENLSALVGKTIGVLKINEVPGLTLKATLNKNAIPWQELKEGVEKAEDKVNLVAITGADAVGVTKADCYLLAEPAASAQAKKGYVIVGDIQALYGGENGYPQAVLVAKNTLVDERAEWLQDFVEEVALSAEWLKTATGEILVSCVNAHLADRDAVSDLKAPLLTAAVLGRCGVRFVYAAESKAETVGFLERMRTVNDKAAAIPADGFFWAYSK